MGTHKDRKSERSKIGFLKLTYATCCKKTGDKIGLDLGWRS